MKRFIIVIRNNYGVNADVLLAGLKTKLARSKRLKFVVGLEIRPSENTAVDDMRQCLPM